MTDLPTDEQLDALAHAILQRNDRGGYTVPTARLYPYQWNWDSAFVALGFATFNRDRAWRELELLVEGQWPDGMIPHILFRRDDPDYFPGPSTWQANLGPIPSGGISQPPVLATIIRQLAEEGDEARLENLFEPVLNWHRWWHTARKPDGCPVIATVHPWETGRDNSPDWSIGLDAMSVDPDLGTYARRDTDHADPSQRPTQGEYDRYVTIVKFGRDVGWDQARLTNEGPFLMGDPGLHFILLRADRDLLEIAKRLGKQTDEIECWIQDAAEASKWLWNNDRQAFCARDVRSGKFSNGFSNASPLCFYANAGTQMQRDATLIHLRRIGNRARFLMPSWDPDDRHFQSQRYWCGPVWPQMNRIVAQGLAEQGETELATRVAEDIRQLVRQSAFRECFDPFSGEGCIGTDFSWTAALWLAPLDIQRRREAA